MVWTDEMLQAWFAPSPPPPDPYAKRGRRGRHTQHGATQGSLTNTQRETPKQRMVRPRHVHAFVSETGACLEDDCVVGMGACS